MCRGALAATGSAFLAFFVGAAGTSAAASGLPWYLYALWVGAGISGALFFVIGLACLIRLALKHLRAIRITDDWRCTYWTRQHQLQVIVWFEDRLYSARYNAECVAYVKQATIELNDDVQTGGTYMGRRRLARGHSGPVMAEFLKSDVVLEEPETATICVKIQPLSPWGAPRKETQTVQIQVINN